MKYTKVRFAKELIKKLSEEPFDVIKISKWCNRVLNDHLREMDKELYDLVSELSTMEDDPQFELSKEELTSLAKKMNKGFPCACCGFLTMNSPEYGSFDICPVCYWEDDIFQFNNIDATMGGVNDESLRVARQNFKDFGASSLRFLKDVRPPEPNEIP